MRLFNTLKNKISLVVSLLVIIGGILSVVIVFLLTANFLVKEKQADLTLTVIEQEHEIAGILANARGMARTLASHSEIKDYFEQETAVLQSPMVLQALHEMNVLGAYSAVYLLDIDGHGVVSTDPRFVNQDYSFRDYFQSALSGRPGEMMAVGVTSREPGYYFSAPVFDDDQLVIGVVVLKLFPEVLQAAFDKSVLKDIGKLMFVDQTGVVLYPNVTDRQYKSLGELTAREHELLITGQRFPDIQIAPLQYNLIQERLRKPLTELEAIKFFDQEDGENKLVLLMPIVESTFSMVFEVDLDGLYLAAYYIALQLALCIFGLMILSVLIVWLVVSRFLKPLDRLKHNIEAVGRGELVDVNPIDTKDELQSIGDSIVVASELLRANYKQLEDRVEDRTKELQGSLKKIDSTKTAILNVLDDVNREHDRTKQLADDLEKFKLAVENASDHVIITDSEGIILYANKAVERITGFRVKEILGKKAGSKELWGGAMEEAFYKKFWDVIKNKKKVFVGELTNIRKSGESYQAEASVSPILDERGEVKYFLGIERDISERKNSEEQVRKVLNALQEKSYTLAGEKAKDEALLAGIGDGIISTDQDGVINIVNNSAAKMLGYGEQDLVGKSFVETVKIVDAKGQEIGMTVHPLVLALANMEKTSIPLGQTYYFVRNDGSKFAAGITASPFVLDGRIVGVILVFRDVSREKDIDQAKTEFVSLASHQLRTPLSTISWYAEMLLTGDAGKVNKEQKEYLEEIYKGNQRMVELVNALLNVSRIELGTFSVEPEDTDLREVAESVFDELKPQLLQKKMKVVHEYDAKLTNIYLDKKLIRIVFQNLLTNALKYTPAKGQIELRIVKQKSDVMVSVKDNGCGIPKKDQKQIFQKLFRADNVKTLDTNGTGLGLYIVRSIVEQSAGGKIWFESTEGKGTTFFVTLPLKGMKPKEGSRALT